MRRIREFVAGERSWRCLLFGHGYVTHNGWEWVCYRDCLVRWVDLLGAPAGTLSSGYLNR